MIELYRNPSGLSVASVAIYAIGMLFHIIAFCSDNWSYFDHDGRRISLGLWRGCWESGTSWICSDDIFKNGIIFKPEKKKGTRNYDLTEVGYRWYVGARILMTSSLVSLFLLEFALVGYSCFKRLEPYRNRLVAVIIGLSAAAGICSAIVIHLMHIEPTKLPNGRLGWSYTLHIFSFIFILITCTFVILDIKFRDKLKTALSYLIARFSESDNKSTLSDSKTVSTKVEHYPSVNMRPEVTLDTSPFCGSLDSVVDNLSYRSGSYAYIPDNYSYSDITVSTDVVSYSQEPGRVRPDILEVDV